MTGTAELKIDIFGDPPSRERITAARQECRHEMSTSEKVLLLTPIPVIDVLAATAVAMFEAPSEHELLRDCSEAVPEDWRRSAAVSAYLDAVNRMGRPLVVKEVHALASHLRLHDASEHAANVAKDVARTLLRTLGSGKQ